MEKLLSTRIYSTANGNGLVHGSVSTVGRVTKASAIKSQLQLYTCLKGDFRILDAGPHIQDSQCDYQASVEAVATDLVECSLEFSSLLGYHIPVVFC